jgi:sulfur carrier protein ThiS
MMKVLVINNDGAGFADYVEVPHGTTVDELFHRQLGREAKPDRYLIRVNRQPVAQHEVLKDGDRLSITPTKIEGA